MNVNEYISSGILECYVLGAVSPQEKQEVECMSHIYPEIKSELEKLQFSIEKAALQSKVAPPLAIKSKILNEIKSLPKIQVSKEEKIIPVQKKSNILPWITTAAAASVAIVFFVMLQNNKNEADEIITAKEKEIEKMSDDYYMLDATMLSLNDLNTHMAKELAMFRNPDFKTVFLGSTHIVSEGSKAIICWSKKDHSVMIAAESMPEKKSDEDYQLWALVDGKPVDLGVLPNGMNSNFLVLDSKIENPDGFAITLEKKGGSPVPTLEQLYLAGNM